MLEVKYLKKVKEVPTNWKEIKIEKFHQLYQVIFEYDDKDTENDEVHKLNFLKDYVCFLLDEDRSYVDMMEMKDVERLVTASQELLTEYKYQEMSDFTHNDVKYYFPTDINKQTFGEYIECSALEKSSKLLKNGKFDVIAEMMARLCKTEDEMGTYLDEETVQKRTETFRDLTMDIVWEFNFFLLNQQKVLQSVFRTYGEVHQQALKPKEQES